MPEMAVALRAQHFGPDHAVADVVLLVDVALQRGLGKTRPSAAGIELGVGFEQRLSAAGAGIGAWRLLMLVFAGERPLGRLLAQHRILPRRQFLAPFRLALLDLAGHRLGVGHGASLNYETAVSWWLLRCSPASASRCSCPRKSSSGSRPSGCHYRQYRAGSGAASGSPDDRPPPDKTLPAARSWSRSASCRPLRR